MACPIPQGGHKKRRTANRQWKAVPDFRRGDRECTTASHVAMARSVTLHYNTLLYITSIKQINVHKTSN